MIRAELMKLLIKERLLLFLLIFLFLHAAYDIAIGYDTTEVIRGSESYYTSFFDRYEGKITAEKSSRIEEEYEKIEKDTEAALSHKRKKQAFESFYHLYRYEVDSGSGYLIDTRGWESVLCHDRLNYLLVIFVVLLGVMLFSVEYEQEMDVMIVSSCGRNHLTLCKLLIGSGGAALSAVFFQMVQIVYLLSTVGLPHAAYPLTTLEFYRDTPYEISLGTALLVKIGITILGSVMLVCFVMLLTVLIKRRELCMILSLLFVVLPRMIFSAGSVLYQIPWMTPLLSANGFLWPDRYAHQLIDNQLQRVLIFQAIKTKQMLLVLTADLIFSFIFTCLVFCKFSNYTKSKPINRIFPCLLICLCLIGCGERGERKDLTLDGSLHAQMSLSVSGNRYEIDQTENRIYCEDAHGKRFAIMRNVLPLRQRITNIFADSHYCYYLLENDDNTNMTVRRVDLNSFDDQFVYSTGNDNLEDFYGLRTDEADDANELLKNIAAVNWFFVTERFIYYQKDSTIYQCSTRSGRQKIIAEAVSDGEIRYQNGVLHYNDAEGRMTAYHEEAKTLGRSRD